MNINVNDPLSATINENSIFNRLFKFLYKTQSNNVYHLERARNQNQQPQEIQRLSGTVSHYYQLRASGFESYRLSNIAEARGASGERKIKLLQEAISSWLFDSIVRFSNAVLAYLVSKQREVSLIELNISSPNEYVINSLRYVCVLYGNSLSGENIFYDFMNLLDLDSYKRFDNSLLFNFVLITYTEHNIPEEIAEIEEGREQQQQQNEQAEEEEKEE